MALAPPLDDWRSPAKRKHIIRQLEERIKTLGNPPTNLQNPIEVEKAFFDKSKNEEEYINYFHNVVLMLTRQKQGQMARPGPMMNMAPSQQMGMNQPPNPGGYQQQQQAQYNQFTGGPSQVPNPSYPPGGGMGMGAPQQPQAPPQYHPGMYPGAGPGGNPSAGMHMPQQARYSVPPQGYPQQGRGMGPNFNNPHVMPGGGGGYNVGGGMPGGPYNQGMMPGQGGGGMPPHGGMMRPMMPNPGPMRMAQRPGMPSQMAAQSGQYNMMEGGVGGVQPVQAIPNPSFNPPSVRPSTSSSAYPQAGGPTPTSSQHMNQPVPSPYSMITSSSQPQIPSSSMPPSSGGVGPSGSDTQHPQTSTFPGSPSVNPATPHAGTLQGPVPSPAPPTPLCPASPATSGIDSPAMQPAMTPEENELYVRKLGELQKYIPLMSKWMNKLSKDGRKSDQFLKLKSLYNLLQDNNRRVPLQTLMKCGVALEKMFDSQTKENTDSTNAAGLKNPGSLPPPPSTSSAASAPTPAHPEPVVPEPKFSSPPQSQSLLDFKMIHSPPALSNNLMDEIQSNLLPDERLPPAKRGCIDEEPPFPPSLLLEFPHLKQFDIQFMPKKDKFDKSTTLKCTLIDEDLPEVPPLTVVLPPTYPEVPPICNLDHYQQDPYPWIQETGRLLSDKLAKKTSNYSFTTLLDYWETSILRAISKELMSEDD